MLYVRQPSEEELRELKRMTRQEIGRVSQRGQMVLLSAQRRKVPEIAVLFEVSRKMVRHWIERFNCDGPPGLLDRPRSGRRPKAGSRVQETLAGALSGDPQQDGHVATFWTVPMLVVMLARRLGEHLSASTVRAALHRLESAWGRPRLAMPKKQDPGKARKQWEIAKAVLEAGPEAAVLYADESRIELLPKIRAMWQWVGKQMRVATPGTNETRTLFGGLNIHTGHWSYLVRARAAKEDFVAFLEHLLTEYASGPIILIVDNFSSHKALVVREWLGEHPRIQIFYLPTYCSHLNPVEQIWLRLKDRVAANRLHASMKLLLNEVKAFFGGMSPEQALTWAGAW